MADEMSDEETVPASVVEFVGPFEYHAVVVDGWSVPFLQMHPRNGGIVSLSLDHRFALDIAVADADRVVAFIADCIAVALGYTCHPRPSEGVDEPLTRYPFSRMTSIDFVTGEPAEGTPQPVVES